MRNSARFGLIAGLLFPFAFAPLAGCGGGGHGSGGIGSVTSTVTANKVFGTGIFKHVPGVTHASDGKSEVAVMIPSTVFSNIGSVASGSNWTLVLRDKANTSITVQAIKGEKVMFDGVEHMRFPGLRAASDNYLIDFTDGGNWRGLPDGLRTDLYMVVGPNGLDRYLGVHLVNGVLYLWGTKQLPLIDGTKAPGNDGDCHMRWTDEGTGTTATGSREMTFYFNVGTSGLGGTPSLFRDDTWKGALSAPAISLQNAGNGWWKTDKINVPDGARRCRVAGLNGISEAMALNISGDLAADFNDSGSFSFNASGGLLTHPSVNAATPASVLLPPFLNLPMNTSFQLELIAEYRTGNNVFRNNVTKWATDWRSSMSDIATVNSSTGNLSTLAKAGATNVDAKFKGMPSTLLAVSVQTQGLTGLVVSVTSGSTAPSAGQTTQLKAMSTMSDGTNQDVTGSVAWSSDATGVVTVNNSGLVTAVANGSTTVRAKLNGLEGTIAFTVGGSSSGGGGGGSSGGVTLTLTLNNSGPVAEGGTWTGTVTASNGQTYTYQPETSNGSAATVAMNGATTCLITAVNTLNTNGNIRQGGAAKIRVKATINGATVTSNEVIVESLGQRGASTNLKRVYIRRSEVDGALGSPAIGNLRIIGDLTNPDWAIDKTVIIMGFPSGSGNVDYYVSDGQENDITAGALIRWDVKNLGTSPVGFYPISSTPNAADIEKDGSGNRFLHQAPNAPPF